MTKKQKQKQMQYIRFVLTMQLCYFAIQVNEMFRFRLVFGLYNYNYMFNSFFFIALSIWDLEISNKSASVNTLIGSIIRHKISYIKICQYRDIQAAGTKNLIDVC